MIRTRTLTAFLALGMLAVSTAAHAQEESECELQPSENVSSAADALEAAGAATDPAEAESKYREAVATLEGDLDGEEPTPYVLAAQAQVGLRNYEEADRLLNRFVELAPECEEDWATRTRYNAWVGLYNEGIQAYQANDTETALAAFETANMMHKDARSLNNSALLNEESGNTDAAIQDYRDVVTVAETDEQASTAMSNVTRLLLASGDEAGAIEAYETYLEAHPDDPSGQIGYALLLAETDRGAEATEIFESALNRSDLTEQQWVQAGVGLFNSEEYGKAATAFGNARSVNPYNKEAMENLVNASIQSGNATDVIPLADTLVAWYPLDEADHQLLASAHAKNNDNQAAMQALTVSQELPVAFQSLQMAQMTDERWVVQGVLRSNAAGAGQARSIPFEFLDASGAVIATEQATVQTPASGEVQRFELSVTSATPIAGFRYSTGA